MAKIEDKQEKISYLKQMEEIIRSKSFERLQKQVKSMRIKLDIEVKRAISVFEQENAKPQVEAKSVNVENKAQTFEKQAFKQNGTDKADKFDKRDNFKQRPNFNKETGFKTSDRGLNNRAEGGYNKDGSNSRNFSNNKKFENRDNKGFKGANNDYKGYKENKQFNSINEFRKSAEAVAVNIANPTKNKFNNNYNKKKGSKDDYTYSNGKKKNSFYDDEDFIIENDKKKKEPIKQTLVIKKAVITGEKVTIKEFSEKIGKTIPEIVKKLMLLGIMSNINSSIDFDTAQLIAEDFGIELEQKLEKTAEDILVDTTSIEDSEENLKPRPPIITVMGHVDHGKTSLLDAIRKTHIAGSEAGGITQHIGAYTITKNDRQITFIDTPGHEAFTAMRARGAKVTDIAILVVAADDGVKPQTIEAIQHIKNAKVPMIVAINKIDSVQANIERVKQQLAEHDVLPEEWGGDAILVPISAKTGQGLDNLLDMMLLVADMENLRANPNRQATALVIESKLDRGRGPVATLLVQNGTLKIGNTVVCGTCMGKIRAMVDQNRVNVVSALPSYAVEVLGFNEVPKAGDIVQVVDEKLAKQIVQERKVKEQIEKANAGNSVTMDELLNRMKEVTTLSLVIKADVQGSLEAIKQSIMAIKNDEVQISIVHGSVGNVNETDILLAQTANAIVVAFNVKTEAKAQKYAEKEGVAIKNYRIIYDMLDDVNSLVKALVKPKYREVFTGEVEIRMVYKITGSGLIAGSYVKSGSVKRGSIAKVYRGDELIVETVIDGLKQYKDDVKEVTEGFECGIKLREPVFKEGDKILVYVNEEIKN